MTVEVVKAEETQLGACVGTEVLVSEENELKKVDVVVKEVEADEEEEAEAKPKTVEKSSSYKEESNFLSDLKEFERKALNELKSKLEEAILGNNLHEKKSAEDKGKEEAKESGEEKAEEKKSEEEEEQVDKDISLWGVPLLPSRGAEGTDVVLLKFLRAREFKVGEAFEMLKKTLRWRKESGMDAVLGEELCAELGPAAAYMSGVDREGHPVCYNVFGVFESEEVYQKTFGTEEKREHFLRWRCQLMEKSIAKLDFKPSGVSSLLQVNDLKNSPGPAKKELRIATKQAVGILQDNYPELVAKNVSFCANYFSEKAVFFFFFYCFLFSLVFSIIFLLVDA